MALSANCTGGFPLLRPLAAVRIPESRNKYAMVVVFRVMKQVIREDSLAKIYTGTGDDGTTGLIGGRRVSKDSPIVETCGSLDELNAVIGVVRSHELPDRVDMVLHTIQEHLFAIGAELATPGGSTGKNDSLGEEEVHGLEKEIDALEDNLQPLKRFILPGGSPAGAALHLARTVSRRAERQCVSLSRLEIVNQNILRYINRLSDLFFVLARYVNQQQSMPETHPGSAGSKD